MKKLLLIPLLLLSFAVSAQTKWYVATTGSDSHGKGTLADPWLTVKHAADTVTGANFDNDTIIVGEGTFSEPVQIDLGVKINIKGAGATSVITTAAALEPIIFLYSATQGTNGNQSISYIKIDGDLTAKIGILVTCRSNVSVHHCTVVDCYDEGIHFEGTDGGVVAPATYAIGNKVYNNTVTNCAKYDGGGTGNVRWGGQNGMLIYNNTITQTARAAGANGFGIKYCCGGWDYNTQIYGNTITIAPRDAAGMYDFAIETHNTRGGILIHDNVIQGVVDFAGDDGTVDTMGCGFAAKVYNNSIGWAGFDATYEHHGVYLEMEQTGGMYIYNNYFHKCHSFLVTSQLGDDKFEDLYFYYNIINELSGGPNPANGTEFQADGVVTQYDNINFLNNVIYVIAGNACNAGLRFDVLGDMTNLTIRNNIIVGCDASPIYVQSGTIDVMSVENNCFYGNSSNDPVYDVSCTITNKTEQNNIKADNPDFVTNGSDFHLQAGSPAINAGLNVNLTSDFAGHRVPQNGTPDIGAYEYGDYLVLTPSGKPLRNANGKLMIIH